MEISERFLIMSTIEVFEGQGRIERHVTRAQFIEDIHNYDRHNP